MRTRWRDVNAVLDRALDAPPADRPAIVARACDGDPALRAEVERMLAAEIERVAGERAWLGARGDRLKQADAARERTFLALARS